MRRKDREMSIEFAMEGKKAKILEKTFDVSVVFIGEIKIPENSRN